MKKSSLLLLFSGLLVSCGGLNVSSPASTASLAASSSKSVASSATSSAASSSADSSSSAASSSNDASSNSASSSSVSSSSSEVSSSSLASAPSVFLLGDSTMCAFNDAYYYPRYGYGTQLPSYFQEGLTWNNLALSGRSSVSFLAEDNYQTYLTSLKAGDYVVIGFGHNDEKAETARYSDPTGDVATKGSFQYSLYENYVKIALDKGATPILCTPIVRRNTSNLYENNNAVHVTTDSTVTLTDGTSYTFKGGDYPAAVRSLATSKNIPLIDLTALSKEQWSSVGADGALKYHAWTSDSAISVDNTHLNQYGAQVISYLFAGALKKSDMALKAYLKADFAFPDEATYHVSNPNYVKPTYTAPTAGSAFYKTTAPYWGSVFGDVGGASKVNDTTKYKITENSDSTVTLGAYGAGKISNAAGDGIVFYGQQIAKDQDFVFKAKATLEQVTINNQVAFGLMLRDDLYIDSFLGSAITGDYVASGMVGNAATTGSTAAFSKTSGALAKDLLATAIPAVNDVFDLSITRKGELITCTYNTLSYSYSEKSLAGIDAAYDYVGCFVARQAQVSFSEISLA